MVTARNGATTESHTGGVCDDSGLCNSRWGYVEGGIAGLAVMLFVGSSLPMLFGMTRPFGLFSTTALATLSLVMWISLWAGLSLLHTRVRAVQQ